VQECQHNLQATTEASRKRFVLHTHTVKVLVKAPTAFPPMDPYLQCLFSRHAHDGESVSRQFPSAPSVFTLCPQHRYDGQDTQYGGN
jgi:hypothetical protein